MRLFHINGIAKRIVYTAFCLAAVIWVWAGDTMPAQPFCLFHRLTGIPCCGCGGLRAANLLLHGKLAQAVIMNPLADMVAGLFQKHPDATASAAQ